MELLTHIEITILMEQQDQAQVLQYLDKFSSIFNDMAKEVVRRILGDTNGEAKVSFPSDEIAEFPVSSSVRIDPKIFMQQQIAFMKKQQVLWQSASRAMMGETVAPVVQEPPGDKRFSSEDWSGNPMFSYLKQAYLLNAEYMNQLVDSFEFEDSKTAKKVRFYTRQFVNFISPSNYVLTNPDVCREILETKGDSLARGIDNFMRDLKNSPTDTF